MALHHVMSIGRSASVATRLMTGVSAGIVMFIWVGVAQYVATGLSLGVVLGIYGNPSAATTPVAAWAPGISTALIAALLYVARGLWWDPMMSRVTAAVIVVVLLAIGNLMFNGSYYDAFGTLGWVRSVVLSAAQSIGSYAFVGMVIASVFGTAGTRSGRRGASGGSNK